MKHKTRGGLGSLLEAYLKADLADHGPRRCIALNRPVDAPRRSHRLPLRRSSSRPSTRPALPASPPGARTCASRGQQRAFRVCRQFVIKPRRRDIIPSSLPAPGAHPAAEARRGGSAAAPIVSAPAHRREVQDDLWLAGGGRRTQLGPLCRTWQRWASAPASRTASVAEIARDRPTAGSTGWPSSGTVIYSSVPTSGSPPGHRRRGAEEHGGLRGAVMVSDAFPFRDGVGGPERGRHRRHPARAR